MKNKNERKYHVLSKNYHLMNILEKDYFIEIGVISVNKLNKIIKGEIVSLNDIIDLNILSEGIGGITSDNVCDVYYQLNYLINLRLKNSTSKFLLTISTMKYLDEEGCEKYAPIFFIPFDLNYQSMTIKANHQVLINVDLLEKIANLINDTKAEDKDHFVDEYRNKKITSVADVDRISLELLKYTKTSVEPTNYITIAYVEYPDFTVDKNYMTAQRSLYETSEEDITKRYFKEVHAVLPTNINQKHIILKAHDGENFSVDGRLGSGKTYTIINIIADQIQKGKTILYVNQDSDNIYDIEKNISYLGFDNYTYNLNKNIRSIGNSQISHEINSKEINPEILDNLFIFQNQIQKRLHGYKIQTIFERLAILKKEYPNLEKIYLENDLEYHEVNKVYNDLVIIENAFNQIDSYASNIWHRLQVSHNNISKDEIVSRLNTFNYNHNLLHNEIKSFCQKYNLIEPNNINGLYKLIAHIYAFVSVRPLENWKQESKRREIKKHLHDIQALVDINYNLNKYYRNHINEDYKTGRMEEIFKLITEATIDVDENYHSKDVIFFNRLISYNYDVVNLANKIKTHLKFINEGINSLLHTFNINTLNDEASSFFLKLSNLFNSFKWNRKYIDSYIVNSGVFTKVGNEIVTIYNKYLNNKEILQKYIARFDQFTMSIISEALLRKNKKRHLMSHINVKEAKKDNVEIEQIIQAIEDYYDQMDAMKSQLSDICGRNDYDENSISQFINLYNFIDDLTKVETHYFRSFLDKLTIQRSQDSYLKTVKTLVDSYKEECYKINDICHELRNYNIIVSDHNIVHKLDVLKLWVLYLEEVHKLTAEIKTIFKKNEVNYNDIVELIQNDITYKDLLKQLDDKKAVYNELLGKYYKGLDTVINEVGQTIEHYGEFLKSVKNINDIDSLFASKFNMLLDDVKHLDNVFSNWTTRYRAFSVCFKGGQPEMALNTFDQNNRLLKQFTSKTNQIEDVLQINQLTEGFLEYGLRDLYEGIRSYRYVDNISNRFLFTVYTKYYQEIFELYPELKELEKTLEIIEDYTIFEQQYCQNNIQKLVEQSNNIKKINSLDIQENFGSFNKIIQTLSKTVKVFYASLDIFNSNLDLSFFDLVLIDDAHLSSANKYSRVYECKQIIAFGNSLFQTSVSNALMKRIGNESRYNLSKSYIKMSSSSTNEWDNNNQYIFTFDNRLQIISKDSFLEIIEDILNRFKKSPTHIFNILVYKEETRRKIYTNILTKLVDIYTPEELINIFFYNIRIINASSEGNRYVNEVLIYYDDFIDIEESLKELVFKNFLTAYNNVVVYYTNTKSDKINKEIKNSIEDITKQEIVALDSYSGITKIISNELIKKGIAVNNGFGKFDLVIPAEKPIAITILGKENEYLSNFVDDYLYYRYEYKKHNWKIITIYIVNLIENFDETIKKLLDTIKQEVSNEK